MDLESEVGFGLSDTLSGITYPPYWSSTIGSRRIGSPFEKSPTLGCDRSDRADSIRGLARAPPDLVTVNVFKDHGGSPRFYVPDVIIAGVKHCEIKLRPEHVRMLTCLDRYRT